MTMPVDRSTGYGNEPGRGSLRPAGVSVPDAAQPEANLPSTRSKASQEQLGPVTMMRDIHGGNWRLQECGPVYLPMGAGEDPVNYSVRKKRAVFLNITRNTIEGLVGFIFRSDPKLGEDVPPAIVGTEEQPGLWENIDNAGTHGDVFLQNISTDAMWDGHAAIFVEYPATGGTQTAAADGGKGGVGPIRPYWLPILKANILSWRTTVENGRTVLTQLVLKECQMVPDGDFGEKEQERYRVLYRQDGVVGFRLLEVTKNKTVVEVETGTYPTQDEIPVAEITTAGSRSLFESDPPFLDLAFLNLAHYRQWSDQDTSIYKTCTPIYCEAGVDPPPATPAGQQAVTLGPNNARRSTNPNFKSWYTSHDGAALGSVAASLESLKTEMAMLGLAALASSKRVAETARAKELDKGATDSALAVTARGIQDGAERALYFTARYLGLDDGGSIEINRDYGDMVMDAATMTAYATLAEKLNLPVRVILEKLVEGRVLPENVDLDELEDEMEAAALANAVAMPEADPAVPGTPETPTSDAEEEA